MNKRTAILFFLCITGPLYGYGDFIDNQYPGLYYREDVDFGGYCSLGFDDGPNMESITVNDAEGKPYTTTVTEAILDILGRYHIHATFFVNGKHIVDMTDGRMTAKPGVQAVLRRMVREGHTIGNHTFHHRNLKAYHTYVDGKQDEEDIIRELRLNEKAVDTALGFHYQMKYFRPPYANGGRNSLTDKAAHDAGYSIIILHTDTFDWMPKKTDDQIIDGLPASIRRNNGGSVLVHDLPRTARLLPRIIEAFQEITGREEPFVSLDALMKMKYN